jgi:hypothetical protein
LAALAGPLPAPSHSQLAASLPADALITSIRACADAPLTVVLLRSEDHAATAAAADHIKMVLTLLLRLKAFLANRDGFLLGKASAIGVYFPHYGFSHHEDRGISAEGGLASGAVPGLFIVGRSHARYAFA